MKNLAQGVSIRPSRQIIVALTALGLAATCSALDQPESTHWSFVPPVRVEPPPVSRPNWVANPIDSFVLARLDKERIAPSPEASRETLFRRVSLDLIGLPPTLDDLDAYIGDASPDAYEKQIDRLLASPHFGEKWARWWLDVAGYADSDGYLSDFLRPNAWRYRQWVVDALNANMRFDEFTVEQLGGDLLPNATSSQRIATGFLRNTLNNREGGADIEEFRVKQVVARTNMIGAAWLGLTVSCAQCHDHKFDPISQKEFFQLYAFFDAVDEINIDAPLDGEWEVYQAARPEYEAKRYELLAPVQAEVDALQAEWERKMLEAVNNPATADATWARQYEVLGLVWGQNYGEGQLEGTLIVKTPITERTQSQKERLLDYFLQNGSLVDEKKWADLKLVEVTRQLDDLARTLPLISRAPTMMQSRERRITHIQKRGDFRSPGDEVGPATPKILPAMNVSGAPSRIDLARWLVQRNNPLTARVVVNRFWHELFGNGLAVTTEDFGTRGSPPSHPELLDWLAVDFADSGWDIKHVLKQIVMSATYRQSSDQRRDLDDRDPNNVLLARKSRVRLSAELVRDNALAVSGLLNDSIGGPSVRPPQPESVTSEGFSNAWTPSEGPDRYRRGLYTFIQRTSLFGQSVTFDLPDPARLCTRRERSNTPLQALNLLNDPLFVEAAAGLAQRIESFALRRVRDDQPVDADACIEYAFRTCLARKPRQAESERLAQYLAQQVALFERDPSSAKALLAAQRDEKDSVEPAAWTTLCSVLLNLDEFITRE